MRVLRSNQCPDVSLSPLRPVGPIYGPTYTRRLQAARRYSADLMFSLLQATCWADIRGRRPWRTGGRPVCLCMPAVLVRSDIRPADVRASGLVGLMCPIYFVLVLCSCSPRHARSLCRHAAQPVPVLVVVVMLLSPGAACRPGQSSTVTSARLAAFAPRY